jgi:acyl carrier protein
MSPSSPSNGDIDLRRSPGDPTACDEDVMEPSKLHEQVSDPSAVADERYSEALATVSQHVADMLRIDVSTVQPVSVLLDLGAQSFDFVVLVLRLERTFGIELPRSYMVPDPYTVDTLTRAVAQLAGQRHRP